MTSCNTNPSPLSEPPHSSTPPPFHNLTLDCIHVILHYHVFYFQEGNKWQEREEWCRPEDHASESMYDLELEGMGDCNWNFLCKFAHCCHFFGGLGLKEFLSGCRNWYDKPTFYYLVLDYATASGLVESGAADYLRGVTELYILEFIVYEDDVLDALFNNIRGVKKLSMTRFHTDDGMCCNILSNQLQNLRGIQEAYFRGCDFVNIDDDDLENLRGIKTLVFIDCWLETSTGWLKNLRGIQELVFSRCDEFSLRGEDLKDIRGVKFFEYSDKEDGFPWKDKDFEHFKGVEYLYIWMDTDPVTPISDSAFKNLRGVKDLTLRGLDLSHVTESAMDNLRGVECVYIPEFRHLESAALKNIPESIKSSISDIRWNMFSVRFDSC